METARLLDDTSDAESSGFEGRERSDTPDDKTGTGKTGTGKPPSPNSTREWLKRIFGQVSDKVETYERKFTREGYTDTSFIAGMTDKDLKDIQITDPQDRHDFRRHIKKLDIDITVPDDVDYWLELIGLQEYKENFKRAYPGASATEVFEDLKVMTEDSMKGKLGIEAKGEKKILDAKKDIEKKFTEDQSGVDNSTPGVDNSSPGVNNPTPGADNSTPSTPGVDNSTPGVDNSTPGVDNSTPGVDNSTPGVDNSTPGVDNSTPGVDNSSPGVDNSSPGVDNSTPGVDNSTLGVENPLPCTTGAPETKPVYLDPTTEQFRLDQNKEEEFKQNLQQLRNYYLLMFLVANSVWLVLMVTLTPHAELQVTVLFHCNSKYSP
uniref:SAM domain-containing protein n=1 Tax=Branchiostoma floridae TaxID=7739 RepID=C3ZFJ0_BRAFL|eukprot:XP_002592733.1 hypothetical protein BRAFLDRAFT_67173 [Branchiostoma floridae]